VRCGWQTIDGELPARGTSVRVLRWIVIVLAASRALYSFRYWISAAINQLGGSEVFGVSDVIVQGLQDLSPIQTTIWLSYAVGYAATAWLVFVKNRLALLVVIFSVVIDMGYWIFGAIDLDNFTIHVMSTSDSFATPDMMDGVINLANFLILIGVLVLERGRILR
jgi:hypothetical protein